MIGGLSWGAWVLLIAAVGTGLAIQVLFFVGYRRRRGAGAGGGGDPGGGAGGSSYRGGAGDSSLGAGDGSSQAPARRSHRSSKASHAIGEV